MPHQKDQIYASPQAHASDFVFDERVAHVFTDMINRSVPGYAMILEMISVITRQFAKPDTACLDLGCSLGASTLAIRLALQERSGEQFRIIAVDNSPAMVDRCRVNLDRVPSSIPTDLRCEDLLKSRFNHVSVTTLNFTLQFIALEHRDALLQRIADATVPGGALILSEKLHFEDENTLNCLTDLHHGFKRARGYSDLEIAQKRAALENVLLPETFATHKERLLKAGFSRVELWFQCFNFVSMLAIK